MADTTSAENRFVNDIQGELDRRGWSRQRLCDRGEIDSGQMSRIMNRQEPLSFEIAVRIATALEMSVYRVLTWSQLVDDPAGMFKATETELLSVFNELQYGNQETLIYLARGLLEMERRNQRGVRINEEKKRRPGGGAKKANGTVKS